MAPADRVWTVPNALTVLRLLGIPVFLWLFLVEQADGWALAVLAASGLTDWLDGWIARRTGSESRIGSLLDPLVDRLFIVSTVIAMGVRGLLPWWLIAGLILRDAILAGFLPALRRRGITGIPVRREGKAATLILLIALPTLVLGSLVLPPMASSDAVTVVGRIMVIVGFALYLATGVRYAADAHAMLRRPPVVPQPGSRPTPAGTPAES
ncbi:MAG: CDP-alcohol phosphatidyltransferase family protein [Actinomycetales bacterium]|nr:CDP-alcohol phosphatidyltransferase family protein [Actinomycetales bacterium]